MLIIKATNKPISYCIFEKCSFILEMFNAPKKCSNVYQWYLNLVKVYYFVGLRLILENDHQTLSNLKEENCIELEISYIEQEEIDRISTQHWKIYLRDVTFENENIFLYTQTKNV